MLNDEHLRAFVPDILHILYNKGSKFMPLGLVSGFVYLIGLKNMNV